MKKLFVTLAFVGLASVGAYAQATVGSLTYNTVVSSGKFVPIYDVDKSAPTKEVHGNDVALYAGRDQVKGTGFWAELWAGKSADSLSAVAGTLVHFKAAVNAIDASKKVDISGTAGGDTAFIQLRVWGADATSWADVLTKPNVARGASTVASIKLGGSSADGTLFLPATAGSVLEGFGLYTVPEPSVIALGALGLGALVLRRRK